MESKRNQRLRHNFPRGKESDLAFAPLLRLEEDHSPNDFFYLIAILKLISFFKIEICPVLF